MKLSSFLFIWLPKFYCQRFKPCSFFNWLGSCLSFSFPVSVKRLLFWKVYRQASTIFFFHSQGYSRACEWAYLRLGFHVSQVENILNIIFSVMKTVNDSLTNAKDGDISDELVENIPDYKTTWWWTCCLKVQQIWMWNGDFRPCLYVSRIKSILYIVFIF